MLCWPQDIDIDTDPDRLRTRVLSAMLKLHQSGRNLDADRLQVLSQELFV